MENFYIESVKDDVREWIRDNVDLEEYKGNREGIEEKLNDELFCEDAVTGNASGSYTFSSYQAEQNLVGNWDLLMEALEEFGETEINPIEKGAEWCDVTIRCYLLGQAIAAVLDELEDDGAFDEDEDATETGVA